MDNSDNSPQSLEDLNKIIEQKQKKEASVSGYVVTSLVFAPFSTVWVVYRTWKKGLLYRFAPVATIVYTILFALYSLLLFSSPGAVSSVLGKNLQKQPVVPSGQNMMLWILTIVLTIIGIAGGFYLRNKAKKEGSLSNVLILSLILILILQFFVGLLEFSFVSTIINQSIGNNIYEGL